MDLTAARRRHMPRSAFGLPGKRAFPMNDPTHDRLAIAGATRAEHAGNISHATEEHLKAEARAKLNESK